MSYLHQWTQLIRLHGRGVKQVHHIPVPKCGCTGATPCPCSLISCVLFAQIWRKQPPCHSLYITYYFMILPIHKKVDWNISLSTQIFVQEVKDLKGVMVNFQTRVGVLRHSMGAENSTFKLKTFKFSIERVVEKYFLTCNSAHAQNRWRQCVNPTCRLWKCNSFSWNTLNHRVI